MKKGFTLMEVLAVLLVIAVVVSMAMPVLRSIRFDIKNEQAKGATKKLAEAVRSYYQDSRGHWVTGCFVPTDTADTTLQTAPGNCVSAAATGIPAKNNANTQETPVANLFACGYLAPKDFAGIPYKFCAHGADPASLCQAGSSVVHEGVYAVAWGASAAAGEKYGTTANCPSKSYIYVDEQMEPLVHAVSGDPEAPINLGE